MLFVVGAAGLLASCSTDFLDREPLDQISGDLVWKDGPAAEAFVTEIYNGLGQGGFFEQMLSSLSDETVFTHAGRNINVVNQGDLSPSNLGWVDETYDWNNMYNRIRACNIVIENLSAPDRNEIADEELKARLLGEAYFLRGYFYHQLLRYYGSIPLITKVYSLDEDYSAARNTFEECVDFIVDDCDSAALQLEGRSMAKGRATALAALALKSRILLYAASDLHHIPVASSKSSLIAQYGNPEFLGYTGGDRTARWTAARDAAKAVMDAAGGGYKLDLSSPATPEEGQNNYFSIAMGGESAAENADPAAAVELLFARHFSPEKGDEWGARLGRSNGPNGYHNWAGNTPLGLLVDDYEMADGTPFSWSNPTHKANPYEGRDPRFYASILYDGAPWKPRDLVSGNVDPANQIQTGSYDIIGPNGKTTHWGLDTRFSSIEDWNGTRTGYYMRKFIDPDPAIIDASDRQVIPWPFFRYTEAVFNYVEACIELNQLSEATLWLNRIRFRAGMPAVTETSQADLRERYRQERRIEMAFEEQRYHDTRRWMIAEETLGRDMTYITISGKFKPGQQMSQPYRHDKTVYEYTYTPVINTDFENRTWVDKMYFRPFSRDEVNRNSALVQNPGYE